METAFLLRWFNRYFIRFEGVTLVADVYFNGICRSYDHDKELKLQPINLL